MQFDLAPAGLCILSLVMGIVLESWPLMLLGCFHPGVRQKLTNSQNLWGLWPLAFLHIQYIAFSSGIFSHAGSGTHSLPGPRRTGWRETLSRHWSTWTLTWLKRWWKVRSVDYCTCSYACLCAWDSGTVLPECEPYYVILRDSGAVEQVLNRFYSDK